MFITNLWYNFEEIGPRNVDENAVTIVFAKRVQLKKTSFLLSIPSLLTGVGGAISSGQTLMWMIATFLGLSALVKRCKQLK